MKAKKTVQARYKDFVEPVCVEVSIRVYKDGSLAPAAKISIAASRRNNAGEDEVVEKVRLATCGRALYLDDITAVERPFVLGPAGVVRSKVSVKSRDVRLAC